MRIDELFPDSSLEDWQLYLNHSLVLTKFVTDLDYALYFVLNIQSKNEIKLKDLGRKKYISTSASSWDLLLPNPDLGFYSLKRTCVWFSRKTDRQNKKGICEATYELHNLFAPVLKTLRGMTDGHLPTSSILSLIPSNKGSEQGLYEILNTRKRFFSLAEAAQRISVGAVFARALNKSFALSAGFEKEHSLCLWYYDSPIGFVDEGLQIFVTNPLFFQETFDAFGSETEVIAE